jgi:hypothetical protein
MPDRWRTRARLGAQAAGLLLVAAVLGGCTAAAPTHTASPTSEPRAASEISTEHSNIALTCSVMSTVQTSVANAVVWRGRGQLDDSGLAGVIITIPAALSGLLRNPNAGLQSEVRVAGQAVKSSPPSIAGAVFDPNGADFEAALASIASACAANNTKIIVYGVQGDG